MLSSLQNPLVKQVRKLHRSQERHKQNLLLLEGTNLVKSAIKAQYPLQSILVTQSWLQKNSSSYEQLSNFAHRVEIVRPELMPKLTTTVNPDGIVATASRDYTQQIAPERLSCGLILARIQDPGNLGTIIRTSVATGVDFVWLSDDSVDLDNPKVLRASVGEWFKLNARKEYDLVSLVTKYRSQGMQIVATSLEATKTHWQVDFRQPTIILLGNEAQGLSADLASLATEKVKIPLANDVESLNVAIATAFILAEYQRQIS